MPLKFDVQKYQANYDPISGGPFVSVQDVMGATSQMWGEVLTEMLKIIPSSAEQLVPIIVQGLPQLMTVLLPTDGTSSPLVSAFLTAVPNMGAQVPQLITSVLPQLFTSIESTGGQGLAPLPISLLAELFTGGGTFLPSLIPGLDASTITSGVFSTGLYQPLTDAITLGLGAGTGLGLPDITSLLSTVGTDFGALIGMFPMAVPGLSGSDGLSAIYHDLLGILGTPKDLGGGNPIIAAPHTIPLLGELFDGAGTFLHDFIPNLDASKLNSGILATGLIPGLDASQTISGIFGAGLIPGLDASKITSGVFALAQLPTSVLTTVSGVAASLVSGVLGLGNIPNLPASQTTSGIFGTSLIPGLDASKITSGVFALAQLPTSVLTTVSGVASTLISGVLALGNIPNLPASQTTSGTFGSGLIPGLDASKIISGLFPMSIVNGLLTGFTNLFPAATVNNNGTATPSPLSSSITINTDGTATYTQDPLTQLFITGQGVAHNVFDFLQNFAAAAGTLQGLMNNLYQSGSVAPTIKTSAVPTLSPSQIKAAATPIIARANTTNIADTGDWIQRFTGNLVQITANVATPTTVNASSWAMVTHILDMSTNNHYVQVTMSHDSGTNDNIALFISSNNSDDIFAIWTHANQAWIAKAVGAYTGFPTARSNISSSAGIQNWLAGDVLRFERTGNVYTVKQNGVAIITWPDTNNTYTGVDYQHRDTGAAIQMVLAGHGFTDYKAGDL